MQAIEKQIFLRKLRPLTKIATQSPESKGIFFDTLVVSWTNALYPSVSCEGFLYSTDFEKNPYFSDFLSWLISLNFLEGSYWLSSIYALWSGEEHRQRHAMYFTPPSITARLLDDLEDAGVDFAGSRFIDPACGGAAFLAPIAQRIRHRLKIQGYSSLEILEHIVKNVHGTDIDEKLCGLSRHFLRIVLREEISETNTDPQLRVACADSLRELSNHFGAFDVVISNPPYRKMSATEVKLAGEEFSEVAQSQPNLYGLFIALCVKLLREGAISALVTPTSFLTGQYFTNLRKFLSQNARIIRIGMISDRKGVFIDVEQETALTLLQRRKSNENEAATTICVVARDGSYRAVGDCILASHGDTWPIPRTETDVLLLQNLSRSSFRLKDYGYRARIGGFVWNRDSRPSYFSDEIGEVNPENLVPLLWSSDIGLDGKLKRETKKTVHTEPSWVDYGDLNHGAVIKNPSIILQRVTSNDQPRRLVGASVDKGFLEKYKGFVAENHVVVIEQITTAPIVGLNELVELLSSYQIDRYFRCISSATNVSIYELSHLPLPPPSEKNLFTP